MIDGVIFDIDGTLLDSLDIWGDVGIRYLKQNGVKVEDEKELSSILWPMTMEESSAYLKYTFDLAQSEAEIREGVVKLIEAFYLYEVQLKAGAKELLEMLQSKRIPMALATTGDGRLAEAALRRLQVWDYFTVLYTASELRTTKQEPLIFYKAAECLGTEPGQTYVVEDTFYALMTAKNAGFRTLAVYDKAGEENWKDMQAEADLSVQELTELLKPCCGRELKTGYCSLRDQ